MIEKICKRFHFDRKTAYKLLEFASIEEMPCPELVHKATRKAIASQIWNYMLQNGHLTWKGFLAELTLPETGISYKDIEIIRTIRLRLDILKAHNIIYSLGNTYYWTPVPKRTL